METLTNSVEEKWNTYSHALGVMLGLIGTVLLLLATNQQGQIIPLVVYGVCVVLLFTASTLYHANTDPVKKKKLRVFDHMAIYYLIAGTYTPVCLWVLWPSKGALLLMLVWAITLFGTVLKLFFTGKFEVFSLVLYGVMGWLVVLDLAFLRESMPAVALNFLALGGAFYTIGIIFYAIKKIPYNHFIWHLFVLGGAISHWCMIKNLL